uniref:MYB-CC type transcription factor LHEQLE-containing domain-containing protein n=1 Tax=Nelumbo nucifera TaxID=4432 RepID=A0A822YCX6_NELNU|nr:TPA_asm: hypothetical protein HUJ06_031650 [Nelumbo nucifera]
MAVAGDRISEASGALMSNTSPSSQTNKNLQISEAIQIQIEVQRRLHEQLEVQRHLQLRIEAQGKYLQSVLEKAQETLGRQNLGSVEFDAAKMQFPELVSKVSAECLNSTFPELKELQGLCLCPQQTQKMQPTDCSVDSCLTSCEGSQKDQEIHNIEVGLRPYQSSASLGLKEIVDDSRIEQPEPTWGEDLNENKMFSSSIGRDAERIMFPMQRSCSSLSTTSRVQGENRNASSSFAEARTKEGNEDDSFLNQNSARRPVANLENDMSKGFRLPHLTAKLDLNTQENDSTTHKQFDLNGFSWT